MSDIALVNRDIMTSELGDILIVDENDDIIQMAVNNVLMIYGANEFHENMGNMVYRKRHKISEREFVDIAGDCKNAILQDSRVANVTDVTVTNMSTDEYIGRCGVSFSLVTIDGTQLSSGLVIDISI